MSVIAAMIGAGGLGGEVLKAMQTINIGLGVEGGIGIVIIAILPDRINEKTSQISAELHPKGLMKHPGQAESVAGYI